MARRLVNIDRDTPMLMPPSIQDWVSEDDMAHLVLDAVALIDPNSLRYNWRGSGSQQYPPELMLALLIYCYAHGIFSSRKIQRATYRDVAVRFITGDTHPDHDTIATFRRDNAALFKTCFVKVLQLAQQSGLARMGEVSLDGSIIPACGSKRQVLSKKEMQEQLLQLEAKVEALTQQAEATDQHEAGSADGTTLPEELTHAKQRRERLRAAMKQLDARTSNDAEQREQERERFDKSGPGEPPRRLRSMPAPTDSLTLSEPEARMLPLKGGGYAPAYNVQLAVEAQSATPLILACDVCDQCNDRRQLEPMTEQLMQHCPATRCVYADKGYDNSAQIYLMEQRHGVSIECAMQTSKRACQAGNESRGPRQRTRKWRAQRLLQMQAEDGRALRNRRLRATTVEPVFGWIKKTLGFERFHLKGLRKVRAEWSLVCLGFNLALLQRYLQKQKQQRA